MSFGRFFVLGVDWAPFFFKYLSTDSDSGDRDSFGSGSIAIVLVCNFSNRSSCHSIKASKMVGHECARVIWKDAAEMSSWWLCTYVTTPGCRRFQEVLQGLWCWTFTRRKHTPKDSCGEVLQNDHRLFSNEIWLLRSYLRLDFTR